MDIRSIKTRQRIQSCFLELLEEKHVSKISVTELCHMAGINRATFYKHYLDIPDLQESMEREILEDFQGFVQGRTFSDNGTYRAMLMELLAYFRQYGRSFCTLCSPNASSDLAARVFRVLNDLAFPVLRQKLPDMEEQKAKMLYQYIAYGCGSVLNEWLGDSKMSMEETADFIMLSSNAVVEAAMLVGKEPGQGTSE